MDNILKYLPYDKACKSMTVILSQNNFTCCNFHVWEPDDFNDHKFPELLHDNHGNSLITGDWYVIITCNNGYEYYINVTHDSVLTMCAEVFGFIQHK